MDTKPDTTALERSLANHVFEPTQKPLGQGGAEVSVQRVDGTMRIVIKTGFPVAASGPRLTREIQEFCEPLLEEKSPEVTFEWSVDSHAVQHGLKPIAGVKNIIAVASGKGGVGKSTLAANFALALVGEGARVGLLDADIYGPSQPTMLGLVGERPETKDGKTLEPLQAHGLEAMSIGFLVDDKQPMAWRGPMVTSALNQLLTQTHWGDLDYLFVDMPPGTGDIQLTLAQRVPVSGAVIVTTPQDVALADARKALEMFQKVSVPVLGVVENMSVHVCSNCGHEEAIFGALGGGRLSEEYEIPLLGQLPLTRAVREAADSGRPAVLADGDDPMAVALRKAALRIAAELAATGKDYSQLFPKITVEEGP